MNIILHSEEETRSLGKKIALSLKGGDIIALQGDLGAGKTTFVKGVADGLGIEQKITSPTFTLMNVYGVRNTKGTKLRTMVHIDTYRLKSEQELIDIGVEDYLDAPDTICIIEWPEKIENLLRNKKIKSILIEHTSENERHIIV